MRPHILVPDMEATTEIDILEEVLQWEAEQDDSEAKPFDAAKALENYKKDPNPNAKITIGYIPARTITELDFQWVEAVRGREDLGPYNAELGNKFMAVCREYVRAGVRGHTVTNGDFDIEAAIDIYERNMWLHILTNKIKEYNSLPTEKKMESSSNAGMSPENTTASHAGINPSFDGQEDAKNQEQ